MTVNEVAVLELPDKKTLLTLMSAPNDSEPLRMKKFEFDGLSPFSVKLTAIAVVVAPVFLMTRKRVAYPKFISLICPHVRVDDVTYGVADMV